MSAGFHIQPTENTIVWADLIRRIRYFRQTMHPEAKSGEVPGLIVATKSVGWNGNLGRFPRQTRPSL